MTISTKEILEKRGNPENGVFNASHMKRLENKHYSLRRILIGPFAFEVQLIKIECHETEDYFGHDELSLDIFSDREYVNSLKFRLKDGQKIRIRNNNRFQFKDRITFLLYEHDSLDPDDFIGKGAISGGDLGSEIRFKRDGAKYDLHYKVVTKYHFPETAEEIVEAFKERRSQPVWSKILRNEVADQLIERINSPKKISQGPTSFCGPAAVLFEMARHMPRRYVQMVIDLYENGSWNSARGTIRAPQGLLGKEIYVKFRDDGSIRATPEADWIALTSMRDSANNLFSIDEPDDVDSGIKAGAMATEVAAWCPQLLGWRHTDIYTTTQFGLLGFKLPKLTVIFDITEFLFGVFSGDAVDGLKVAKKTLNQGGAAMLQIDSELLKHDIGDTDDDPGDPGFFHRLLPNVSSHFISLYDNTANISHNSRVTLKVYTWGSTGGKKKIEISEEGFEREMFAYVFTKPGAPI